MGRTLNLKGGGYVRRPLDAIFAVGGNIAVLRALDRIADGTTGREIAHLAGINPPAALEALGRMEAIGLVRRMPVGRAYLFTLNRRHFLVEKGLLPLLETERQFRDSLRARLREAFSGRAMAGAIFGSMARGDEGAGSDLDVCLLVESDEEKEAASSAATGAFERVREEFGVGLSPIVFTRDEFVRGFERGESIYGNILRDAETFLGPDLREIARDQEDPPKQGGTGSGVQLRRRRR